MKYHLLNFFIVILLFTSCKESTSGSSGKQILAYKTDERELPENTLKVLNFNKLVVQEQNSIIIKDSSDTNNQRIIYKVDLPDGKEFYDIKLERYLILKDTTGTHSQMILDMQNNRIIDLREEGFSSGGVSINPLHHSILYRLGYFHPDLRASMHIIKYTSFDYQTLSLLDSCNSSAWAPGKEWFWASKFMYKEDNYFRWEHALYNLNGDSLTITRDPIILNVPRWTDDGSSLIFSILGDCGVLLVEFDWSYEKPRIKRKIIEYGFCDPLWSPDGNYLVYTEWYEDGHFTFGNDILITDKNLVLRKAIIQHDDIIESPIFWNIDDGLVTQIDNKIIKYEITNLY